MKITSTVLYGKIIKFGIYIIPFIPLLVSERLFFPFITTKNFAFRIIIEILLVIWALLALRSRGYWPKKSIILYSVSALYGILTLATIFSANPYRSLWSNAERMEGLFGMLHLFVFFLIIISVFKKEKDWLKFWWLNLTTSFILSIYGIFQLLGKLEIHQGGVRLDATLGNASYLAIYLLFNVFLALYLSTKYSDKRIKIALVALAVLQSVIIYNTATRGAILGLLGGLILMTLLSGFLSRGRTRKFALMGLLLLILIPSSFWLAKDTNLVQTSPVLSRFANISPEEATTQSRFILWNMAYEGWKERPILGWGPENFGYVFIANYDARMWRQEPWFDRAHNVFIDWLTSAGILGFLAYVAVLLSAIIASWQIYKRKRFSAFQLAIFIAVLVAYAFNNLFIFDNLISYYMFFSVLAYLHFKLTNAPTPEGRGPDSSDDVGKGEINLSIFTKKSISGIVLILVLTSLYLFNVKPMQASNKIVRSFLAGAGTANGGIRDVIGMQSLLEEAIKEDPRIMKTEAREQAAQRVSSVIANNFVSDEEKNNFLEFAIREIEEQVEDYPTDIRARTFLSGLNSAVGNFGKTISINSELIELSPNRQQFYFSLGEAYLRSGQTLIAVETFKKAYDLDNNNGQALENYALSLIYDQRPAEAELLLEESRGIDFVADERFATAYVFLGDAQRVKQIWETIVEKTPSNAQYRFNLAQIYIRLFEDQKAINELNSAIELAPSFITQGESIIQQIIDGTIPRQ